jgi:hypothetical protein
LYRECEPRRNMHIVRELEILRKADCLMRCHVAVRLQSGG